MNIQILFSLERPFLPKDYHSIFVSFIKKSLECYNPEMYRKYYEGENAQKKFVFALYLGKNVLFQEDKIELENTQITMNFRTSDLKEGFLMYNAFLNMQETNNFFPMNNNSMYIVDVKLSSLKKINRSKIRIQMMSPLIVRDHNHDNKTTKYLSFEDPDFEKVLTQNIKTNLEKWGYNFSLNGFSVKPYKAKMTTAIAYKHYMNANIGEYIVTGDPRLLNFLYGSGLSPSLNSSGFNMFEVLKEG